MRAEPRCTRSRSNGQPTINKPSKRIVVFVTPAQKRAISATADALGISISELMRRTVIAFSATSDQVRAASIVDRLNAPREPDALALVLRKSAKPLRAGRGAGLRPAVAMPAATATETAANADSIADGTAALASEDACESDIDTVAEAQGDRAERDLAQAVARLAAQAAETAEAEARAGLADGADAEPLQPLSGTPFARSSREDDEQTHPGGHAPEGGKFA